MLNIAWGIPEYNQFGTDEFLEFCRLVGAEPQIALNLGSGTPQEAADWVRYVDEHWSKHKGLLWELGNELWGNWNWGYPTLEELARRTLEFSKESGPSILSPTDSDWQRPRCLSQVERQTTERPAKYLQFLIHPLCSNHRSCRAAVLLSGFHRRSGVCPAHRVGATATFHAISNQ